MKEYSVEEILELREKIHNDLVEEYRKNKEAWDNKDLSFPYDDIFLYKHAFNTDDLDQNTIPECISTLQKTMEQINEFEKNNFFLREERNDIFVGDSGIGAKEGTYYIRRYLLLITKDIDEHLRKRTERYLRYKVGELIDGSHRRFYVTVDHRMLNLFLNGTIDWTTLKKLAYNK